MAEKRKPTKIILLKNSGNSKSNKIEIFDKNLFTDTSRDRTKQYRIRTNGKWFPKGNEKRFFKKTELLELINRAFGL